jgi:gamma-glutamyl-gamma-aminobutyrate hydrolase PuuD/uncharacterized protein YjbI with pentapeptide repeats
MSIQFDFDPNRRPIAVIHDPSAVGGGSIGRIVQCALPFFCMSRPGAVAVSLVLGGTKVIQKVCEARRSQSGRDALAYSGEAAAAVALIGLSVFRPRLAALVGAAQQVVRDLLAFRRAVGEGTNKEAGTEAAQLGRDLLYLASLWYSRPDLFLLSLATQGCEQALQSDREFREGRYLEGFSGLALSFIKAYGATGYIEAARREWFGRNPTQEEFNQIMTEIKRLRKEGGAEPPVIDLNDLLAQGNFRPRLEGVSAEDKPFSGVTFRDLTIVKSNFKNATFDGAQFVNTALKGCDFSKGKFRDATFKATLFDSCRLKEAVFARSIASGLRFQDSYLGRTSFTQSLLQAVDFVRCQLPETSFFQAQVRNSELLDCDLTDTLLFDAKADFQIQGGTENEITRSVVGVIWDFDFPQQYATLEVRALREFDTIVAKISGVAKSIDPAGLEAEVKAGLAELANSGHLEASLPQALLARASEGSAIHRLREMGEEVARHSDGILLPGGPDIEPELYGAEQAFNWPETDYRRSIFEASLYRVARRDAIPLWGICRGAQAIGVNAGAQLLQHVEGHGHSLHLLRPDPDAAPEVRRRLQEIIGHDELLAQSMHHQAVPKPPKGFTALLEHRGVVKMMVADDGFVLATQIHPEVYKEWGMLPIDNCSVIFDPRKAGLAQLGLDVRSWVARLLDRDVTRPYDPAIDNFMAVRNRQIFSYFLDFVNARKFANAHIFPAPASAAIP